MGYDRAINIFSPDGKLYQVEYAFEAVKQGWTSIGIRTNSAVILLSEKRKQVKLMEIDSIEKVVVIDTHIGATFAGFGSDGRRLADVARYIASYHRYVYGDPITVEYLTKQIADIKHLYTQQGGVRPFGVSMIFAGIDIQSKTTKLFRTEPSGHYVGYYATVIGIGSQSATDYLEEHYNYNYNLDESIKLAFKAMLYSISQRGEDLSGFTHENFDLGYATIEEPVFRIASRETKEKYLELSLKEL